MSTPASGTIITTGTGSGLGTSIALKLLSSSPPDTHQIFTVRPSQNTSSKTYQSLQQAISKSAKPSENEILHLALDDFSSVRAFAADINARVASGVLPRIKALILNAAVQNTKETQVTKDGYEVTYQVNYLSNFLLVLLLLPSFAGVGPDHLTSDASAAGRIVLISSDSHDPTRAVGFPPQIWPSNEKEFSEIWHASEDTSSKKVYDVGMGRYGMSKLLFVMFMFSLQRRLDASPFYSNLTTVSIDPGWMATNLLRGGEAATRFVVKPLLKVGPYLSKILGKSGEQIRTTDTSADHVFKYTVDDWGNERPKAWFVIHGKKGQAGENARDEAKQENLWGVTVKELGLADGSIPGIDLKAS